MAMTQPLLPCVEVPPTGQHKFTVIWLHGLGDCGHGFSPIVPEFKLPESLGVKFIFPHAPERPVTINNGIRMRAWYDIKSLDFKSRADSEGVRESAAQVEQLIEAEIANGIPSEKIVIAGFSQGGVIALHIATRVNQKFAGILALSTYMCEPEKLSSDSIDTNKTTPIFVAHGNHDDVVPVSMGQQAYSALTDNGFIASWKTYPMLHNVCPEEINDISQWLQERLV